MKTLLFDALWHLTQVARGASCIFLFTHTRQNETFYLLNIRFHEENNPKLSFLIDSSQHDTIKMRSDFQTLQNHKLIQGSKQWCFVQMRPPFLPGADLKFKIGKNVKYATYRTYRKGMPSNPARCFPQRGPQFPFFFFFTFTLCLALASPFLAHFGPF